MYTTTHSIAPAANLLRSDPTQPLVPKTQMSSTKLDTAGLTPEAQRMLVQAQQELQGNTRVPKTLISGNLRVSEHSLRPKSTDSPSSRSRLTFPSHRNKGAGIRARTVSSHRHIPRRCRIHACLVTLWLAQYGTVSRSAQGEYGKCVRIATFRRGAML